jgi:transcriptional regulator with GAF, ATPase, and Fis domain
MQLGFSAISWRKLVLCLLGLAVLAYTVGVLAYVYAIPDLGLRTAFDTTLKKFEGTCSAGTDTVNQPKEDDRIVQIGDVQTDTWAHLLQAQNYPSKSLPVEVANTKEAEKLGSNYARIGESTFIRIRFIRLGESQLLECWCLVDRLPPRELIPSILWFFLKLGLFTVGALVFWKRPNDTAASQFFVLCIVTLGAYMGGYHWSHIVRKPILIVIFMLCSVLLPAVLLHFNAVFPRPNALLRRYGWRALLVIYGPPLCFLAAIATGYYRVRWLMDQKPQSMEAISDGLFLLRLEICVYLGVAALWYVASIIFLSLSYRSAVDATERNQVKWILYGSLGALVPIGYSLILVIFVPDRFSRGETTWPMFAASVCFTAAFIISITRYRLMQLDQIISAGMIYFAISFLFGLIYYVVVSLGALVAASRQGSPLAQAFFVSTIALVLMLILDRARSRFKKALDRRFYRDKNQLNETLRRMSQAIDQLVDPQRLARQLLQASAEVLTVVRGAVYLREGTPPIYRLVEHLGSAPPLQEMSSGCPLVEALRSRGAVVAETGRPALTLPVSRQLRFLGGEVAQALTHEGDLVGLLVLGPKLSGFYSAEDLNLLAAFSQLTTLALKSAERHRTIDSLNRELQTKVEKISEQQRRIIALQSQLTRQAAPEPSEPPPAPEELNRGLVGSSPVALQLLQLVKKVSSSESAVLIRGESGTGKELLARALHEHSPRAGKAFVKVHCAALSPGLLESELFGHVKGAFTGAHKDKIGRFELADGGTLFLDEIGDITLEVQIKLLRVLQEMTFERVGSSEPLQVDVRVIAATHQNLERFIKEGRFRDDLYYRINVISVLVPPLRERREDIPELALHFLKLHGERSGKTTLQIDDDALAILKAYSWPGNIRQLENVIERAVVVAEGTLIGVGELPGEIVEAVDGYAESLNGHTNGASKLQDGPNGIHDERLERDRHERERLVRALALAKGNKAEAARALGLARSTLVSRLKKLGLS